MALRGLKPEMIVNLCDVVERRFFKMSTQFEAGLANRAKEVSTQFEASSIDRVKDRVRKEFHRCLWSWSLPIWKRVF